MDQYLDNDHSYTHFREGWHSRIFNRDHYDNWLLEGGQSVAERAADRVTRILDEHVTEPLPAKVSQEIENIVLLAEEGVAQ